MHIDDETPKGQLQKEAAKLIGDSVEKIVADTIKKTFQLGEFSLGVYGDGQIKLSFTVYDEDQIFPFEQYHGPWFSTSICTAEELSKKWIASSKLNFISDTEDCFDAVEARLSMTSKAEFLEKIAKNLRKASKEI